VDQNPTDYAAHNFGIRPLPNLESKFVAANTLIPVGYDASLFDTTDEIHSKKTKLKELNHQIFLAKRNVDKQRLKEEIKETRHELAKAIEDTGFVSQGAAQLLACWDMFDQNSSSPFFDAEWMFGVKNGFDIVIGNPPYIRVQNLSHDTIDLYKSLYETAWKRIDISTLFIECLSKSLAKNGVLCYISSNQFLSAEYGRLMRRYLLANKLIYKIVDFADLPVFENAITYVSVFMLRNTAQDSFGYFKVPQLPFVCPAKFTSCFYDEFDDEPWSFVFSKEKDILKKIQSFPPLINFAYAKGGIISGNDSCYIFEKDSFPAENENWIGSYQN
jgi:Eco57I restriction endonuclease.